MTRTSKARKYERTLVCLPPGNEPGQHDEMVAACGEMEKSQFLRELVRQSRELGLPDFRANACNQRLVRLPEDLAVELDKLRGRIQLDNFLAELVDQALKKGLPQKR